MNKPMQAVCNAGCGKEFTLNGFTTLKLPLPLEVAGADVEINGDVEGQGIGEGDIEKVYFLCPHCLHEYVVFYADTEIRALQGKIRKVDRRIGKPHYDQRVANKIHAKLMAEIQGKMARLKAIVESEIRR